jgi:hypothetical protein
MMKSNTRNEGADIVSMTRRVKPARLYMTATLATLACFPDPTQHPVCTTPTNYAAVSPVTSTATVTLLYSGVYSISATMRERTVLGSGADADALAGPATQILGSPIELNVQTGVVSPADSQALGLGLRGGGAGETMNMVVNPFDAGRNRLVDIPAAELAQMPCELRFVGVAGRAWQILLVTS